MPLLLIILGKIYLDSANLNDKNRSEDNKRKNVSDSDAPILLPNIEKAVYWFTRAAKDGNPAAQGMLSDLYRQGIGVQQDYIMAYVWQSLSISTDFNYNDESKNELGIAMNHGMMKFRDTLYSKLTTKQKDEAQKLLQEYTKKYSIAPSEFSRRCQSTQAIISLKNMRKIGNYDWYLFAHNQSQNH